MEMSSIFRLLLLGLAVRADIIQLDGVGEKDTILLQDAQHVSDIFLAKEAQGWNDLTDFFLRNEDLSRFRGGSPKGSHRQKRQLDVEAMAQALYIANLHAHQYCEGVRLLWKRPPFATSPDGNFINSEFSHYNVYRSSSYFTSVQGMTPYASGTTDFDLAYMTNVTWMDRDPVPNDFMWYAVTMVARDGRERKDVTSVKAMYVGSFGGSGSRIALTPNILKGTSLHVTGTYNSGGNQYFVAWDVDSNGDGKPDRVFGIILNQNGSPRFRTILEFTVGTKGHIYQGKPQVAYNPNSNQYLLIFELSSRDFFGGMSFLASRSVSALNGKKLGTTNAQMKANENIGGQTVPVSVINGRILHNTVTTGYSISGEIRSASGRHGCIFQNVNPIGKSLRTLLVFGANLNSQQTQIFQDTKRGQIFIVGQFPSSVASSNSQVTVKKGFVFIVTKRNATGEPLSNPPQYLFVGETNLLDSHLTGYYNEKSDRLHLFWFDIEKGSKVIKSSKSLMNEGQKFIEGDYRPGITPVCKTPSTASSLSVTYMPGGNTQVMLWEEIQSGVQKVGGFLVRPEFTLFSGLKQSKPFTMYNAREGTTAALWIEQKGVGQANVFFRLLQPVTHRCPVKCAPGYRCMRGGDCVRSYSATKPCRQRNGGCSNTCLRSFLGPVCTCPATARLEQDRKTCKSRGRVPVLHTLVTSLTYLWEVVVYSDGGKSFERTPLQSQNFVAVAYDTKTQMIYWGDGSAHTLNRASVAGNDVEVLVSSVVPDAIKIDILEGTIYWTDAQGDKIEMMFTSSKNRKVLVQEQGYKPRALEFYKENGQEYMYWTSWSKAGKLERGLLVAGQVLQRQVLITTSIVWPNGLAIDSAQKKLYWADASLDKIEVTDLMGNNRQILGGSPVAHPYSLAIWNDRLLITDWAGTLLSINRYSGGDLQVIANSLERPAGLVLLEKKLSAGKSCPDPGMISNGIRSGIDFSANQAVKYTCKEGYMLYGPSRILCLADGSWSSKPPICAETRCANPMKPSNGNAVVLGNAIGDGVIYTCDPGFKLIGSKIRTCTNQGKWSGNAPRCLALPVFEDTPNNQTVRFDRYTVLPCKAHGPEVKTEWLKDGKVLVMGIAPDRIFIYRGTLIFQKVRFSDAGTFTCRISNAAGAKEVTVTLTVLGDRIEVCGQRKFETRQKIFGGIPAAAGSHPWMALIWNKDDKKLICGGSLIARDWVLTAAHCILDSIPQRHMEIKLGKIRTNKIEDYEQVFQISRTYTQPYYDPETFNADVALIKLSKKAIFTDYVRPICLPWDDSDMSLTEAGNQATVVGWGSKTERQLLKGKFSRKLLEVDIPIVSHDSCKKKMRKITPNMICAGAPGKDACNGDSGGPLIIKNRATKRHVLVGIVSWGEKCGRRGSYGVYTKVSNFLNWIQGFTQERKD